jgi:EmrB/QacA subfamily drug resistance transporter
MDVPTASVTVDQPADGLPSFTHQQIVSVMLGIMLCIVLSAIDITVVVPAVPAIAADLHGFGHLSWIVSAYLLTSTAAMPISAKLSDIYGRRTLLMLSIILFVVTSVLCGLSQSLLQLIVCRAIQGIGGGGLVAISQTVIADVVAPRERGRYQGYMAGSWGLASIFGPILGGWMTDYLSWHWIFWINAPIGIAALVLSNRALRLLKARRPETRIDYLGAVLLTGLSTSCLLLMSWGGTEYPWASAPILGLGSASVLLLGVLYFQERLAVDPILPLRIFANTEIGIGIFAASLGIAAMLGGTFLLPLFFQLIRGANASASGTLLVPFLALNALGALRSGGAVALQGLDPATLTASRAALSSGFHIAFLACAGLSAIAALACAFLRDLPLQSSATKR